VNRLKNIDLLVRILVPVILIILLGIAPRPHELTQNLWRAGRVLDSGSTLASYQQAANALVKVAEYVPWRIDLWEVAGRYAFQGGDAKSAITYLENADSLQSLSDEGRLILGDAYRQAGDLDTAIDIWEVMVEVDEPDEEVYRRLLNAHRTLGDAQAVLVDLEALARIQPADADIRYQLGLLLASQRPEAALPHLVQAADLDPDLSVPADMLVSSIRTALLQDEPAYIQLESGRALASLGEWELAEEAFHQATIIRPDYGEAWAFLGEAQQHLDEPNSAEAFANLEKALTLEPDLLTTNMFLGLYWQRQGRFDLALESLERLADLYPDNPAILTEQANTLALLGELDSAYQIYQRAVDFASGDPTYYHQIVAFSLAHDYQIRDVALPAARQAIILNPNDPASLDTMGQVLIRLGDTTSAERFLNRAVQIEPLYAPAHLHLGLIFILQEDTSRAVEKWSLVQTLAPGTPTAEQARRLLQNYFP
jgi:tetratricopeptide (TPR) repeat protein